MNAPLRQPPIPAVIKRLQKFVESDNIAELLDEDKLSEIGATVCQEYAIDERSNSEWRETAAKALSVAMQVAQEKNYPFAKASNVKYPLITVAALQFNARAYPAIVDGQGVVKAKVVGSDNGVPKTDEQGNPVPVMGPDGQPAVGPDGQPQIDWEMPPGAKRAKADRISEHMTYQLLDEMEEWEEDTDTLLIQLPIVGTAFRKVWYDPELERNKSQMVNGTKLVVHKDTKSLETCPRITQIYDDPGFYPHEIEEKQRAGIWLEDFDPGLSNKTAEGDVDAPHVFLEQHRLLDLDNDGYREPYIVTVHKDSEKVVRIKANYGLDDITPAETKVRRIKRRDYYVKFPFIPNPDGGFYDIGFGWLLQSLGAAIDTSINQMLDAGHLQNAGGGFIGSGVRLKKGTLTLSPGVYKTVDATGSKLREAIVNMEHPGPSSVLFNLLGLLIDAAKDITAVQDILTGDSKDANQTATTTLALIEQGMKVFTAIYKRIYRSLKREFKLLYRLNAENLPEEAYFNVLDTPKAIARSDYQEGNYDVCPQADPKLVTDMQRLARAQALMGTVEMNPGALTEILRRYYMAIGVEDVESLLPKPQPPDPVQEAAIQTELRQGNASAMKDETAAMKNVADISGAEQERILSAFETGANAAQPQQPNGGMPA